MIAQKCYTRDWIYARRDELGGGDPTLIEKTIHAFALLCHLVRRGVPLVFKGGTSLMLRLPRPRRLSIDLDILCPLPAGELDAVLAEAGRTPPFLRHEEDPRDPMRLPARRHFKFFYNPYDLANPSPHILLDVVKEKSVYPHCSQVPVRSPLMLLEEELGVQVPTVENLLGDKLTAFAPNTVGVPCTAATAMQVMKQLFDVGELFDAAADFLAARLRDGNLQGLAAGFRYDPARVAQLSALRLSDPVLQRLRAGNPEAFHYWSLALGAL